MRNQIYVLLQSRVKNRTGWGGGGAESLSDESADEEDDGTTCKICKFPWM